MEVKDKTRKPSPRENASVLSTIFLWYSLPMFKSDFAESDLTSAYSKHKSSYLSEKLEQQWKREESYAKKLQRTPCLQRALIKTFGVEFLQCGLVLLFSEAIRILQALAIGQLISYYPHHASKTDAYWLAGIISVCGFASNFLVHPSYFHATHIGMKIRIGCCALVYQKLLKLSRSALSRVSIGQIVNLLSNDVSKFDNAFTGSHYLWLAPLESVFCTFLIYRQMGWCGVIGVAILVFFIPLQLLLSRQISKFRFISALRTDERVKIMSEIISGIKVIKMYTWEKAFAQRVSDARRREMQPIKSTSYLKGLSLCQVIFTTRLSLFASFLTYLLFGNEVTSQKVFVVTSLYQILRVSVAQGFAQYSGFISEAQVSIKRLNHFLLEQEILQSKSRYIPRYSSYKLPPEIIIKNASTISLTHANLTATSGEVLAIIGPVGCGKTNLLHAILKELPLSSGSITVNGEVSYASQDPWLFAGTIQQNILFGQKMNRARYESVISICCLGKDLLQLPDADLTIVGDRGITLSGGQKARINLARAVYKKADIYLLDDPLSAVDSKVGKELFEGICEFLKGKIVVLVTHQLQYLKGVDKIVYLEKGIVKATSSVKDLKNSWIESEERVEEEGNVKVEVQERIGEEIASGSLGLKIYVDYFKAGGSVGALVSIFVMMVLTQVLGSFLDYYLSYWVQLEEATTANPSRSTCIVIFSTLISLLGAITVIRAIAFLSVCLKASTRLHDNMFSSITKAKMQFFATNNAGRILNRFSKDLGYVDEFLPPTLLESLQLNLNVFGLVVVVAFVNPWMLIPIIVMVAVVFLMAKFYLRLSRNIKRLEGTTRSPVFAHISATIQGLTTIRAVGAQEICTKEFEDHQDLHSAAWFSFIVTSRAFACWLDFVCTIFISIVTFGFLVSEEESASNVGLGITQAVGLLVLLQFGVRQSTEVENQMTSVERILQYEEIDHEENVELKPRETWPEEGKIQLENLTLRYSSREVLKDLSLTILGKEKIGIVGRTGAGKSSLINAIFQMAEMEGRILVDGVDVSSIDLRELRSKISIIPQEPVLFSGTMRLNLDPFRERPDEQLWSVLEDVEMKAAVPGLDEEISNLSGGQKQLICLARAVLRGNKILVLDEATANIDPETDALIQKAIRKNFAGCTVLTIAHRLNSVMDSDRILVMDNGRVEEFGHAFELLGDSGGVFFEMVQQTGAAMAQTLTAIAEESFNNLLSKK